MVMIIIVIIVSVFGSWLGIVEFDQRILNVAQLSGRGRIYGGRRRWHRGNQVRRWCHGDLSRGLLRHHAQQFRVLLLLHNVLARLGAFLGAKLIVREKTLVFLLSLASTVTVRLFLLLRQVAPPLGHDLGDIAVVCLRKARCDLALFLETVGEKAIHWTTDVIRIFFSHFGMYNRWIDV